MRPIRARPSRATALLAAVASQRLRRQWLQHPTSMRTPSSPRRQVWLGRAEEDVVDALGVGLDVAREAAEHLADDAAGLLRRVLEEDVVAVGDEHEVVAAPARLPLLRRACGSAAPRRRSRRWRCRTRSPSPRLRAAAITVAPAVAPASSTHRHIVPRSSGKPSRAKRSSMRWSGRPSQYLSTMIVREQRRRGQRAREALGRHRRGLDVVSPWASTARYFTRAMTRRRRPPRFHASLQLSSKPDALGLALGDELLEERVGDLDALFLEGNVAQVAPARGLASSAPWRLGLPSSPLGACGIRLGHCRRVGRARRASPRTPARAARCRPARPWRRRCAAAAARAPAAAARATRAGDRAPS